MDLASRRKNENQKIKKNWNLPLTEEINLKKWKICISPLVQQLQSAFPPPPDFQAQSLVGTFSETRSTY